MAHKQKGGTINNFENKKLMPLTKEILKKHLLGGTLLGVYPILEDNTSYFIAADFDGEHWLQDSKKYIEACKKSLQKYPKEKQIPHMKFIWHYTKQFLERKILRIFTNNFLQSFLI